MGFGGLKSPIGLQVLNNYLADKSYTEGYVPSQADVAVFEAVSGPPPADPYHTLCGYNHIKHRRKWHCIVKMMMTLILFGSDDEESKVTKTLREVRLAQYESKKPKKPALVAKSSILLDVKPWDDETDMAKLEKSIQVGGLVWGSSKLVPVGYGIKKLQIQYVVGNDKVGTDMLEEQITAFEDYLQSMDVAAFNKI
ncbi:LOW QUALITY PROTEIN: Elongation factor 1-beta [Galemys pyrenaicus]|uniref:Elongation factor 1-beta n=1 Tax=Galemys pyrenaicus TaxID=202257 RepID=A0A8J6AMW6_GALPY|nr:LOW QUALITY PROTEIN: Elongation factor 1-beta [Galemys pyrenaicus]